VFRLTKINRGLRLQACHHSKDKPGDCVFRPVTIATRRRMIKMKAFITVIGEDKIGIIQGVTTVLRDSNVNVIDISQTLQQNFFTMIMLTDLDKMKIDFKELKNKLENLGKELELTIKIQHEDIFNSMHKI
jgi:ACT domain-containing protein